MKRIISRIFLALICAGLVAGTVFLDEKLTSASAKPEISAVTVSEKGSDAKFVREGEDFSFDAGSESEMTLVFFENAVLRFNKGSSGVLRVSGSEIFPRKASLKLSSGRLWLNTLHSTLDLEIETPVLKILAAPGIFDIFYSDSNLTLRAIRRNLEISFLGNRLVLPENRQMTISESKIKNAEATIAKLRYSKLLKEFPFFALEEADSWMNANSEADAIFFEQYEKKVFGEIREGGPKMGSDDEGFLFNIEKLIQKTNLTLTFDPAKKEKKLTNGLVKYFDAGMYAMLTGKETLAKKRFAQFAETVTELQQLPPDFEEALASRLDRLAFASPRENFFEAKSALRAAFKKPALANLQTALRDVLDLAASGADSETEQKVVTALRRFGSLVDSSVKRIRDQNASEDIFFQSVLLNDFLARNPLLLREEFLKISELFESAHLDLIATREEADDQRQFFISEKLRAIQMIKSLMDKEQTPFQDGRRSILLLANQIDALKPTFSDAAVLAYFDEQLANLKPFIAFLRSFQSDRVRGSFDADLKDFESRQAEIKEVTELLSTAGGGDQISASRREELAGMVASDFGPLEISNIKIILPAAEDDSRVKVVSAEMAGKSFTATYDTARKVFSDLVVEEEKIPNAIRLENFAKFFLIRLGKLVLPAGATIESLTEAPSPQTLLEKAAKTRLLEELIKLGISVEEKYLGLENLKDDVIHVRLALLGQGSDAKVFSFDVSQKGSVASNLKVQTVSGELPVNDTFALRELPVKVEQIYERAVFEKQKEEELKKFVEESTNNE